MQNEVQNACAEYILHTYTVKREVCYTSFTNLILERLCYLQKCEKYSVLSPKSFIPFESRNSQLFTTPIKLLCNYLYQALISFK